MFSALVSFTVRRTFPTSSTSSAGTCCNPSRKVKTMLSCCPLSLSCQGTNIPALHSTDVLGRPSAARWLSRAAMKPSSASRCVSPISPVTLYCPSSLKTSHCAIGIFSPSGVTSSTSVPTRMQPACPASSVQM